MSRIEWTDETWNSVIGCSRVSPGCTHCYAERQAFRCAAMGWKRYEGLTKKVGSEIRWTGEVRLVPEVLERPLHWRKPRRVFVNSMSDLFHEALPDEAIDRVFAVMALAHWHTYQVLTKRADRMLGYLRPSFGATARIASLVAARDQTLATIMQSGLKLTESDPGKPRWPLPNVWLGVSPHDQESADRMIPLLLQTPAAKRFISLEPMLGPVDLTSMEVLGHTLDGLHGEWCSRKTTCLVSDKGDGALDWVIVGGESGPGARPMQREWARSVRDQCRTAGVAFFYKQEGSRLRCDHNAKGGHFECFPPDLQLREYPR